VIATLDTNVLVSGTVYGRVPGSIINAAVDRRFILALSPAILREYQDVLSRSRFGLLPDAVELLVRDMESHALIVYPTKKHQIVADDPDARSKGQKLFRTAKVTVTTFGSTTQRCAKPGRRRDKAFLYGDQHNAEVTLRDVIGVAVAGAADSNGHDNSQDWSTVLLDCRFIPSR
jgi:hypothetical protein